MTTTEPDKEIPGDHCNEEDFNQDDFYEDCEPPTSDEW